MQVDVQNMPHGLINQEIRATLHNPYLRPGLKPLLQLDSLNQIGSRLVKDVQSVDWIDGDRMHIRGIVQTCT